MKWLTHCLKQVSKVLKFSFLYKSPFPVLSFYLRSPQMPIEYQLVYVLTYPMLFKKNEIRPFLVRNRGSPKKHVRSQKITFLNCYSLILCFVRTGLCILWCFWNDRNQQFSDSDLCSKPNLNICKALTGFFICIFRSLTHDWRNLFSASGIFCVGRYQPGYTISKTRKNTSSTLLVERTWVQALPLFSACCCLGQPAWGTDLKSPKGLYSSPSSILQNSNNNCTTLVLSPIIDCLLWKDCLSGDHDDESGKRERVDHSQCIFFWGSILCM